MQPTKHPIKDSELLPKISELLFYYYNAVRKIENWLKPVQDNIGTGFAAKVVSIEFLYRQQQQRPIIEFVAFHVTCWSQLVGKHIKKEATNYERCG